MHSAAAFAEVFGDGLDGRSRAIDKGKGKIFAQRTVGEQTSETMDERNVAVAREAGASAAPLKEKEVARDPKARWTAVQRRSARELAGLFVLAFAFFAAAWGLILRFARPDPLTIRERIRNGQFEQAARLARWYLADDPSSTLGLINLGQAQAEMHDYAGLADTLSRVNDRSKRKPEADDLAATALSLIHRCREAETFFLDVLKHSPKGFIGHALNARRQLLRLYGLEGRKDAFLPLVRETLAVVPKFDRRAYLAMRMRLEFENAPPETNRPVLEAMVAADPLDADALAGLGSVCMLEDKLDEAESLFLKAVSLAPADPELRERALDAVVRQADSTAKLKALLDARVPGSESRPRTSYFLGVLAEANGDFELAAKHYARACELDPTRYEYPYKLSQVLHRLGRHDAAKRRELDRDTIQKARSAVRDAWNIFADAYESGSSRVEPSMVLNLATACERLGWLADARSWYQETLRDDPENQEAKEGLKRLDSPRSKEINARSSP